MSSKILVFGSYVADLMARGDHLPVPGETIKGSMFKMGAGGKGFNQGVSAFKSGGEACLVTKVKKDAFGELALKTMHDFKMDTSRVLISTEEPSGAALILVDENTSQNSIMVVPGACDHITAEEVESLRDLARESDYLLLQLETNLLSVEKMIELAVQEKTTIILNPAPVQKIDEALYQKIDYLTPNEVEAEILSGISVRDEVGAAAAADWFMARGVKNVVITLGERGAYCKNGQVERLVPAYSVNAIDTTGAGDAFNGAFVVALAEGRELLAAAEFACAAAALSVQKLGTAVSMPLRLEIDDFLKTHKPGV